MIRLTLADGASVMINPALIAYVKSAGGGTEIGFAGSTVAVAGTFDEVMETLGLFTTIAEPTPADGTPDTPQAFTMTSEPDGPAI